MSYRIHADVGGHQNNVGRQFAPPLKTVWVITKWVNDTPTYTWKVHDLRGKNFRGGYVGSGGSGHPVIWIETDEPVEYLDKDGEWRVTL